MNQLLRDTIDNILLGIQSDIASINKRMSDIKDMIAESDLKEHTQGIYVIKGDTKLTWRLDGCGCGTLYDAKNDISYYPFELCLCKCPAVKLSGVLETEGWKRCDMSGIEVDLCVNRRDYWHHDSCRNVYTPSYQGRLKALLDELYRLQDILKQQGDTGITLPMIHGLCKIAENMYHGEPPEELFFEYENKKG